MINVIKTIDTILESFTYLKKKQIKNKTKKKNITNKNRNKTKQKKTGSVLPAVSRIAGGHHVSGVEHLLGELRDCEGGVALASAGRERGESGHEEVKAGERDHVDGEFSKVCVELTRESEARRYT